jgi:hypothetical protein
MSKARLNYWLDVVIGLAFVVAALTGVAFLLMGSGGYQGGRNPGFQTELLGIQRTAWSDLHTLSSLVMMAGVAVHLALHARWIACVTDALFQRRQPRARRDEACEALA